MYSGLKSRPFKPAEIEAFWVIVCLSFSKNYNCFGKVLRNRQWENDHISANSSTLWINIGLAHSSQKESIISKIDQGLVTPAGNSQWTPCRSKAETDQTDRPESISVKAKGNTVGLWLILNIIWCYSASNQKGKINHV